MSESALLTAETFGHLFEQYKTHFIAVACSYVRDAVVAEDIVTDCFASFWENREKIDVTQSVPAYILTSVKNRCLNWLRDQRTHLKAQQNIHSTSIRIMSQRIATLETCDPDFLFAEEISHIIEQVTDNMSDRMRDVFLASRVDDLTYKEIAEKFGMSVNQVDFEIRKSVKLLREALKDYLPVLLIVLSIYQKYL